MSAAKKKNGSIASGWRFSCKASKFQSRRCCFYAFKLYKYFEVSDLKYICLKVAALVPRHWVRLKDVDLALGANLPSAQCVGGGADCGLKIEAGRDER